MDTPFALAVLHEDPHVLVVSKPAGLLTQGRSPTLEDEVRRYLRPDDPSGVYLGTVHRLDRPVSGVVVWAKTAKSARRLSSEFSSRRAVKVYWAACEGGASLAPSGRWVDYLAPHSDPAGVVRVLHEVEPTAREAITAYRRLTGGRWPLGVAGIEFHPETGRTHQLRAQSAARGAPILGDAAYGAERSFPRGIALHARSLRIRHPITRVPLELIAPLPSSWAEAGIEPEAS